MFEWFKRLIGQGYVQRWLRQKDEERDKQVYCLTLVHRAATAQGLTAMISGGEVIIYLPPETTKLVIPVCT